MGIIKAIIGAIIAIMVFSALLRTVVLPVNITDFIMPAAHAQEAPLFTNKKDDVATMSDDELANHPLFKDLPTGEVDPNAIEAVARPDQQVEMASEEVATDNTVLVAETQEDKPAALDLSKSEVDAFGILNAENGGMSQDLWTGTNRDDVEVVLSRVREYGLQSAAARRLLQRALLTSATPPEGGGDGSWLASRVRTLHAVGFASAAGYLLNPLGEDNLYENPLAQAWVEQKLLHNEVERACQFARSYQLNSDKPFWQHAQIACAALKRDMQALEDEVNKSSGDVKRADPLLFSLANRILNKQMQTPRMAPNEKLNPLHNALMLEYKAFLNPDVILRLTDVTLRKIVASADVDASLRLQAAEKLVNDQGAPADVQALVTLYNGMQFQEEELSSPLQFVKNEADGSIARALLWQAVGAADLASGKALILKVLWERADSDGLFDLAGSLTPDLHSIEPEPNLAWFAPYVVRTALRSGNLPVAKNWWEVLSTNRSLSRELATARIDLALAFAMLNNKLPEDLLENWLAAQRMNTPEGRNKALRVAALLEALELPVSGNIWQGLYAALDDNYADRSKGPGPVWLRLVGHSIEQGHMGQSALLLIEPTLYATPENIAPQGVANMVAGLKYIGLDKDATSMALEAVLAAE